MSGGTLDPNQPATCGNACPVSEASSRSHAANLFQRLKAHLAGKMESTGIEFIDRRRQMIGRTPDIDDARNRNILPGLLQADFGTTGFDRFLSADPHRPQANSYGHCRRRG